MLKPDISDAIEDLLNDGTMTAEKLQTLEDLVRAYPRAKGRARAGAKAIMAEAKDVLAWSEGVNFRRHPKKRELASIVTEWTSDAYFPIQQHLRGERSLDRLESRILTGLKKYMDEFSLRAPTMPPKVRNSTSGSEFPRLYRGVNMTEGQFHSMVMRGHDTDRGYMSFSRNIMEAFAFLGRDRGVEVVFRLDVRDVARGTPWVWFDSADRPTDRAWLASGQSGESEVLLPPGTLVVRGAELRKSLAGPYHLVDVAYM